MTNRSTSEYMGDVIGGFPEAIPNCKSCGQPLQIENAWMLDRIIQQWEVEANK